MIIAIDGFSGTGKGTLARDLAKKLNYKYIDSGAMYRAFTLFVIRNGIKDENEIIKGIDSVNIDFDYNNNTFLNGENVENEIRGMEVSNKVSMIARIEKVREKLVKMQQDFGKEGNIVMDGRDIASVVFPNADIKIFMICSSEIRAKRRVKDMSNISFEEILDNIKRRDEMDLNRKVSPLKKMVDSIEIDSSFLTREGQLELVLDIIKNNEKSKN